ncbi:hypothetical protein [Pseudomonas sp. NFR16]|uniref:DUF6957 family protein n=1 Tax=Pseudomonas sp. NFR16 TaxID=1566248 RepID=UPI0008CFB90D|nr:hypothetical protein [Pseudomonas sp. NFR16]SEJ95439.1 hypothetical protein SAMN03159495_5485 [Pseudomonas sp. NFR16]
MSDAINTVTGLLTHAGTPSEGFTGSMEDAVATVHGGQKPFCIVAEWRIIEVDVDEAFRQFLAQDGLSPQIVYASNVLFHSLNKRQRGDWVRTTFMKSFTHGLLFESVNTLYVLMGHGTQVRGTGEAVLSIGR